MVRPGVNLIKGNLIMTIDDHVRGLLKESLFRELRKEAENHRSEIIKLGLAIQKGHKHERIKVYERCCKSATRLIKKLNPEQT